MSKFISSLIEEAENQILVTNFIDSIFKDAKREVNKCEKENNKNPINQSIQDNECIYSSSSKIIFNTSNTNFNKTNEKVNRMCNPIKEYYSSFKCAKILYCNYDKSCDSNVSTFSKDDNNKAIDTNNSNKRRSKKVKNKRINNINPGLCSKFVENVEDNIDKKKKQDNSSIMKTQISDMQKKKETMANKLSFRRQKKEKKNQKENLQKILLYNTNQMKSHLIQKKQKIDMKKEISNNCLRQYLVKENIEIIKKYIPKKGEKKETNNKMRVMKQKKNNNVKNTIKEIKVLKDNYKNICIKIKVFLNNNKDMKIILGIRKHLEKQKFLNTHKKTLQVEINGKINNLRKNAKVNVHLWRKYKY